jgi:tRNA G10  N-methylase Trm11
MKRNLGGMAKSVAAHATAIQELGLAPGRVDVRLLDARSLNCITSGSIDRVVTSPPYSIALDYVENDLHALDALGVDVASLRTSMTGVRGQSAAEKLAFYNEDMQAVFRETARVLNATGQAAFVIGDATVNAREWTTTTDMVHWATAAGLELTRSIDKIVFGLYSVMKDEKILIFRKKRAGRRCDSRSHPTCTST